MQNNYQEKFEALKCCVIIPTYNNATTLHQVIDGVLEYTSNIILVNDGSTDGTLEILAKYKQLELIDIQQNKGKGNALKNGFRKAVDLGYRYAISIDSDGQHMPSDLPAFLEKIEAEPDSLIIGARNMNQAGIPSKSSFGNRFSNFWFLVDTGIKLPDTQSGYRLYPIEKLKKMKYFTRKFEFEIEVIVRAAWKGIEVSSIPIDVFYAKGEERISHFRPFADFARISMLNTVLFLLAILFFRPLMYFRSFSLKSFFGTGESTFKLAAAFGFGAFMGIVPVWGAQMVCAAFLAHALRLNKAIVLIASNISFGPMVAIIVYASFIAGSIFLDEPVRFNFNRDIGLESIKLGVLQYAIGSMVLAHIVGFCMFAVSYWAISFKRKINKTVQE